MNEQTNLPHKERHTQNRDAITLKILLIGVLIVILIIPMFMIQNLISERENTAKEATTEVQQKWSGPQTIIGPVLTLSYTYQDEKGKNKTGYINYLPDQLDITGDIEDCMRLSFTIPRLNSKANSSRKIFWKQTSRETSSGTKTRHSILE